MEKKENLHANHRQRLKKRALTEGLDAFEPHNVLELMLFYALPHVDTNDIAHELINTFGSFNAVFSAPIEELVKIKGIKEQAATFIKLMPEFCRFYFYSYDRRGAFSPDYDQIGKMFVDFYIGRQEEQISCIFLDKEGTYIKTSLLFRGSMQSVGFSVRPIVDEALKCGAYKVALAHNHPSGSLTPSPSDIDSTRYLNRSLSQMNIFLIEHFVISGDKYKGIKEFVEKDMYPNLK